MRARSGMRLRCWRKIPRCATGIIKSALAKLKKLMTMGAEKATTDRVDVDPRRVLGLWVSAAIAHSGQPLHVLAAQINGAKPGPQGYLDVWPQKSTWLKRRAGPNPLTVIELHQMEQLQEITGYAITDEAREACRACQTKLSYAELVAHLQRVLLQRGFAPTTVEQELSVLIELVGQLGSLSDPERQQMVLRRRLGVGAGGVMTYVELGRRFGVSSTRIHQIEQQGLRKMRWLARHIPIACLHALSAELAHGEVRGTDVIEASLRHRLGSVPLDAALRIGAFLSVMADDEDNIQG